MRTTRLLAASIAGWIVACGPVGPDPNQRTDCSYHGDADYDTIADADEGCGLDVDTDGDGAWDWRDPDSDGDGLSDRYEAGDEDVDTPPRDTDGDGVPDFRDRDSDDDGWEDWREVSLGSNPFLADSDGNGIPDPEDAAYAVCWPRSPQNPDGYPELMGDAALEIGGLTLPPTTVTALSVDTGAESCANLVDDDGDLAADCDDPDCAGTAACGRSAVRIYPPGGTALVAGFAAVRERTEIDPVGELIEIDTALAAGFGRPNLEVVDPGVRRDLDSALVLFRYRVTTTAGTALSIVGDGVVAALLGRDGADLIGLPTPNGPTGTTWELAFGIVGSPYDWGESWTVVGGVAPAAEVVDPASTSARWLTDLADGTAASYGWGAGGCDGREVPVIDGVATLPLADVVSTSLHVALNGVALSRESGDFFYDAAANALVIPGLGLAPAPYASVVYAYAPRYNAIIPPF